MSISSPSPLIRRSASYPGKDAIAKRIFCMHQVKSLTNDIMKLTRVDGKINLKIDHKTDFTLFTYSN